MARRPWFKHFCTASQGASLRLLWDSGDYESYGFYWRLLEMMSQWEDSERPGTMTLSWGMLRRELGWNRQRSSKVLLKIAPTFKIEVLPICDETFDVFIPKWLELQETRGGKRESKNDQKPGRSEKREVRSENISSEQSSDRFRAIQCYFALEAVFQERRVTQEVQNSWTEAFPDSEWVVEKIKQLLAWEKANPSRKKKNFSRFVTNCLGRDWDKRRTLPGQPSDQRFVSDEIA